MAIKAFKQFFIPHKHNDYKPHFFREVSVISIVITAFALLFFSAGTTFYIKNTDMTATVLPAVLVDLTNNARTSNSASPLTRNAILDDAAKLKAQDMASLGYFAHTSPSGITPWHWFNEAGYSFVYAGENLAINFTESVDVETAWLNSPTHRANILSDKFTEIGIATMDGVYQGRPTTYVVQMFGKPAFTASKAEAETIPLTTKSEENTKPTTLPATIASNSSVKGQSVATEKNLETITDTEEFVAVKNIAVEEKVEGISYDTPRYSSWYDRFVFMTPAYTNRIYQVFIWIMIASLLLMTIFEVSRKHKKNIIYGILLLVIMICLIYINRTMFVTSLFT